MRSCLTALAFVYPWLSFIARTYWDYQNDHLSCALMPWVCLAIVRIEPLPGSREMEPIVARGFARRQHRHRQIFFGSRARRVRVLSRVARSAAPSPLRESSGSLRSRPCFGYGDADPSNVSALVHGAEMRVAETRAVDRALRKAYGIGIC